MNRSTRTENDWDKVKRIAPELYDALKGIKGIRDIRKLFFKDGSDYWDNNNVFFLNHHLMIGCMQMEINKIQQRFEDIERKYMIVQDNKIEWKLILREKTNVIFENGVGEIAKIPENLVDIICHKKRFEGKISDEGDYIKFSNKRNGTHRYEEPKVPKSLVDQLTNGSDEKVDE